MGEWDDRVQVYQNVLRDRDPDAGGQVNQIRPRHRPRNGDPTTPGRKRLLEMVGADPRASDDIEQERQTWQQLRGQILQQSLQQTDILLLRVGVPP